MTINRKREEDSVLSSSRFFNVIFINILLKDEQEI